MRVRDILRSKGPEVITCAPDAPIAQLLQLLAERGIGAVVVSADGRSLAGIVSERDVVRGLAREGAQLLTAPVSSIMTADVQTATPEDDVDALAGVMTARRFRHVPVLDGDGLVGLVSIGDVVKVRISELEAERSHLVGYLTS